MEIGQKLQPFLEGFNSFIKKNKRYSVGVDIGSDSIKIVELEKKNKEIHLKNYALIKIKSDLNRNQIRKLSGKMVEDVFKKSSINSREVNLGIPAYSSFITLVEVSSLKEVEIAKEIEKNINKYIPINPSDVVYDWKYLDFKKENNNDLEEEKNGETSEDVNKNSVILVSTTKDVSNEYEKSFNNNGLKINNIEVDCFSIQRAFLKNSRGNYLIIDLGSKNTNFIGILEGQLIFSRNIDLAGSKLTELISKTLGVNKERAEAIKIKQGLKTDSKEVLENVLEPFVDSIVEQIKKRVEEFKEFSGNDFEKIILSGGISEMIGLKDYIEEKIKKDVVYGNPWNRIKYPSEIKEKILSSSPFLSVAVGLALIDFD